MDKIIGGIYTIHVFEEDYICIVLSQKLFCLIPTDFLLTHYYSIPNLTLPTISNQLVNTFIETCTKEIRIFTTSKPTCNGYLGKVTEENFEKIMEQMGNTQLR